MEWLRNYTDENARRYGNRKIEMTKFESSVVCGLIKQQKPKKILELGVAAGGTSTLILKTLDILSLDSTIFYASDITEKYYANNSLEVGYMVGKYLPELKFRYNLLKGDVITEYLPYIGQNIDFLILDTIHKLPGELLDFICILPYLSPNATVILHDTALNILVDGDDCIATRVLFSCVVGDKIFISDPSNVFGIANISAFYTTEDTLKYIRNVFEGLLLPWSYMPETDSIDKYRKGISQYYPNDLYTIFKESVLANKYRLKKP